MMKQSIAREINVSMINNEMIDFCKVINEKIHNIETLSSVINHDTMNPMLNL